MNHQVYYPFELLHSLYGGLLKFIYPLPSSSRPRPWLRIETHGFWEPAFEETSKWVNEDIFVGVLWCFMISWLQYPVNCWVYDDEITTYVSVYYRSYLLQLLYGGFLKCGYPVLDHLTAMILSFWITIFSLFYYQNDLSFKMIVWYNIV